MGRTTESVSERPNGEWKMYDEDRNSSCAPYWRQATNGSVNWCERIPEEELKATGMYKYWDPKLQLQNLKGYEGSVFDMGTVYNGDQGVMALGNTGKNQVNFDKIESQQGSTTVFMGGLQNLMILY